MKSTSPKSNDLREKVLKYIWSGKTIKEAAEVFDLHRNTISSWVNRYRKEGHFEERKREGRGPLIDREELRKYVDEHPDLRLEDIGKVFGVRLWVIWYNLKKIGYKYKKKLHVR